MGDEKKPYRRWVWVLALIATVCAVPLAFLVWGAYSFSEAGRAQDVDCGEAMEFARGRLPEGAADARCTAQHWQDTLVTVDFRMPRTGAAPWLEAAYPAGGTPETCAEDLCWTADFGQDHFVRVEVVYEGTTALVHLTAFDT
ncbi:hypothetical protein [Streptomyces sp. NPDC058955]|uniref:hypothetical protein n=1 Tax=unclassified Streptomyces TaxID=2593676 RepID=UPI00365767EE